MKIACIIVWNMRISFRKEYIRVLLYDKLPVAHSSRHGLHYPNGYKFVEFEISVKNSSMHYRDYTSRLTKR